MTLVFRIILAGFAVYRLAELFSLDDGPFHVFHTLRFWLGKKAAGQSQINIWYTLAQLFACPFCLGIWFSVLILPLIFVPSTVGDVTLAFLGIAGFQTMLESFSRQR